MSFTFSMSSQQKERAGGLEYLSGNKSSLLGSSTQTFTRNWSRLSLFIKAVLRNGEQTLACPPRSAMVLLSHQHSEQTSEELKALAYCCQCFSSYSMSQQENNIRWSYRNIKKFVTAQRTCNPTVRKNYWVKIPDHNYVHRLYLTRCSLMSLSSTKHPLYNHKF